MLRCSDMWPAVALHGHTFHRLPPFISTGSVRPLRCMRVAWLTCAARLPACHAQEKRTGIESTGLMPQTSPKPEQGFIQIPSRLATHPSLSHGAVRCWLILKKYARRNGRAWVSNGTIAKQMHRKPTMVKEYLVELQEQNIIKRVPGGRSGTMVTYLLVDVVDGRECVFVLDPSTGERVPAQPGRDSDQGGGRDSGHKVDGDPVGVSCMKKMQNMLSGRKPGHHVDGFDSDFPEQQEGSALHADAGSSPQAGPPEKGGHLGQVHAHEGFKGPPSPVFAQASPPQEGVASTSSSDNFWEGMSDDSLREYLDWCTDAFDPEGSKRARVRSELERRAVVGTTSSQSFSDAPDCGNPS